MSTWPTFPPHTLEIISTLSPTKVDGGDMKQNMKILEFFLYHTMRKNLYLLFVPSDPLQFIRNTGYNVCSLCHFINQREK